MNGSLNNSATTRLRISDSVLGEASAFADSSADQFLLSEKDKSVLCLVMEELISNCINHSNMKPGDSISLKLTVNIRALTLEINDCGRPFNPLTDIVEQNLATSVDDRTTGGLGWSIITHFCEIIDYSRDNDRNNLVLRYERAN